jgi:hypothetical protein
VIAVELTEVADEEPLATFVIESNKIKADGIHWQAFRPGRDSQRSVFRVKDLTNGQIAELGHEFVAKAQGKSIIGWGVVGAGIVRAKPPLTVRDDPPPPKHAVIEGWPPAPEQQRTLAMHLASKATTFRCPGAKP